MFLYPITLFMFHLRTSSKPCEFYVTVQLYDEKVQNIIYNSGKPQTPYQESDSHLQ